MRWLAPLLLLASCIGEPQCGAFRPNAPRHASGVEQILFNRDFRLNKSTDSTPILPACASGDTACMVCKPTSTTWNCVWGDGQTETVTAGVGAIAYTDPMGRNAFDMLTNARAPRVAAASARLLAAFNGPHTVISIGDVTNSANGIGGSLPYWKWTSTGGTGEMQRTASDQNVQSVTNVSTATGGGLIMGHGLVGHAVTSLTGTVSVNPDEINLTSAAVSITSGTGGVLGFNQDCVPNCATGSIASGSMAAIIVYSTAKTDTEVNTMRLNAYGLLVDATQPVRVIRDAREWAQPWLTGNRAEPFSRGTPVVTSRGIEIHAGSEATRPSGTGWILDNASTGSSHKGLDASTWTDTASPPTVNTNVAAGYFGAWALNDTAGTEMDELVDDNAAGDEGKTGTLNCIDTAATGKYTMSIVARTGATGTTRDKMRLAISTDGAVGSPCTTWERMRDGASVTTLTSTPEFYSCGFTVTGVPTFVHGQVLVGSASADTGSIIVEAPTCSTFATPTPLPDSVTTAPDIYWIDLTEIKTWPTGVTYGADIEIVFTLDYDMPGDGTGGEYLLNTSDGVAAETKLLMFQTGAIGDSHIAGDVLVRSGWRSTLFGATCPSGTFGNGGTDITSAGTLGSFVAGQQYVERLRVMPAGTLAGVPRVDQFLFFNTCADANTCHAFTQVASNTSHTMCASDTGDTYGIIGGRTSGVAPSNTNNEMNGAVARITVKRVLP